MIIIGIDNNERKVNVRFEGANQPTKDILSLDISPELLTKGDYAEILGKALTELTQRLGKLMPDAVTLVVPDTLVTLDLITLPTIAKRAMADAFRTEFRNQYKNHDALLSHAVAVQSNKRNTVYLLTLIKKEWIAQFRQVLMGHGLRLEKTVSASAACCEALYADHSKWHRSTFLFLDVREESAHIVLYDKGRMSGFASLPFGKNALCDDRVVNEYDLYTHDIADLAVINARERAKSTRLTMAVDLESEAIDNELPEGATVAPDAMPLSRQEVLEMAQEMQAEEAQQEEDDYEEASVEVVTEATTAAQVKRYVKKSRKLPVFMQRPVPETPQGMVCENFRAFQIRLLQYARTCHLTETLPDPEFVVVNLPQEYAFLIDALNQQEDNKMEFRLLATEGRHVQTELLEMRGAAGMSSRSHNPIF